MRQTAVHASAEVPELERYNMRGHRASCLPSNSRELSAVTAGVLSLLLCFGVGWAQEGPSGVEAAGGNPSTPASGDTTSEGGGSTMLEQVTVTAQRRAQSAQDVGISMSALSGDQLQTFGLRDSVDVAKVESNVTTAGAWGGMQQQFTIRGVTQNDFADDVESVVAVYVDDTYVAMQQGQLFGMFDLDRVETLKGPQGTLFGRNATGGIVQFITKRPTRTFEGYANVTYGSYDQARIEGALSGPFSERIRGRLSGVIEKYDGWLTNKFPYQTFTATPMPTFMGSDPHQHSDLGGVKRNWALRGQLVADITDSTQLWLSSSYAQFIGSAAPYTGESTVAIEDAAGNQINTLVASPNTICQIVQDGHCASSVYSGNSSGLRARPGGDFFGFINPDPSGHSSSIDFAPDDGSQFTSWSVSAKLTAKLGDATLTAISDYKHYDKNFDFDLASRSYSQFLWRALAKAHQVSQEVRVNGKNGPLTWIGGGYYLNIYNDFRYGIKAMPDSVFPINGWDQPRIALLATKSYSAFGQLEYALTDKLSVIAGARGSRELKDYSFEIRFVPDPSTDPWTFDMGPAVPVPGFYQPLYVAHTADTLVMWKGGLNYKPKRNVLLYADVTQGAKAGSFNSVALPDSEIPYKPEKPLAYEMGVKSTLFGGRARLNASSFYYDYRDYQATRWVDVGNVIINRNAIFYGGEAELVAAVTDHLEAMVNVGYQKNKVKHVPVGGGFRDVETTYAPNWTPSVMLRYTLPKKVVAGSLSVQVDGNWHSKAWGNLNNFSADRIPSYALANARISWVSSTGAVEVALFGNNLFNKSDQIIRYDTSILYGGNLVAVGKPRWVGVDLDLNF